MIAPVNPLVDNFENYLVLFFWKALTGSNFTMALTILISGAQADF